MGYLYGACCMGSGRETGDGFEIRPRKILSADATS